MSEDSDLNLDSSSQAADPARMAGDPSILDTQPIQARNTPRFRIPRWLTISVLPLALVGIFVVLALPSLMAPPPGAAIPYEVFTFGESSSKLDPGRDHLLISEDQRVGLYIPRGIDMGPGEIVMLPRRLDFVPSTSRDDVQRLSAVDLFVVRPDGEVMTETSLDGSILLCFTLTADQLTRQRQSSANYLVERYDDGRDPPEWISLPAAQGWKEGQACAALDHLSLFALSVQVLADETEVPDSKQLEATETHTPELDEIYGLPIGRQEE